MAGKQDNRIVLRLDERIEFEHTLAALYRGVPRFRRQEWIRGILRAGLNATQGGANVVLPAATSTSHQAPTSATTQAPAGAITQPASSEASSAPKRVAGHQPTHSLKGFFGEAEGAAT